LKNYGEKVMMEQGIRTGIREKQGIDEKRKQE
jgi:hypothetical protein